MTESQQAAPHTPSVDFEEVYEYLYRRLRSYFARSGYTSEEAADLIQDALMRVYDRLLHNKNSFAEPGAIQGYIWQTAKNVMLNDRRARSSLKRSGEEISLDEALATPGTAVRTVPLLITRSPDAERTLLARERTRIFSKSLREGLDSLPPRMRQVLLLHIVQDMQYKDIAREMNIKSSTVKAQVNQGLNRIARIVRSELPDELSQDDREELRAGIAESISRRTSRPV